MTPWVVGLQRSARGENHMGMRSTSRDAPPACPGDEFMNRFMRAVRPALICCSFAALLLLSIGREGQAAPPAPPILLGTAWYPEQWPESRWEADLALMEQAGIRMVRVGEFAWSRMEPVE